MTFSVDYLILKRNEFLDSKDLTIENFSRLPEKEQIALMEEFQNLPEILELSDHDYSGWNWKKIGGVLSGGVTTLFDKSAPLKEKIAALATGGFSQVKHTGVINLPTKRNNKRDNMQTEQKINAEITKEKESKIKLSEKPEKSENTDKKKLIKTIGFVGGILIVAVAAYFIYKKFKK